MLKRKEAASAPEDFTDGTFRGVIGDDTVDPEQVETVVLCSGRITWDLLKERQRIEGDKPRTPVLRIEQLYPRPFDELEEELGRFANLKEVRWVQDEPENMGPWPHFALHLTPRLEVPLTVISRPESAAPAVGQASRHQQELKNLIGNAFA